MNTKAPTPPPTVIDADADDHPENEIINGVEVKDVVSGFSGVVLCITEWWNGCLRLSVYPRGLDDKGEMLKAQTFDMEQLEYVGPGLTSQFRDDGLKPEPVVEEAKTPKVRAGGDREDAGARAEVP